MIDYLTYALLLLVLVQPSIGRAYVAGVFALFTAVHNLFMYPLDGIAYYASDAVFYLFVIAATGLLTDVTRFTIQLHRICIAAIILDALGWVVWMLYLPPDVYNVAFMALYAIAIVVFIRRDEADGRGYTMDNWGDYIRVIIGSRNPALQIRKAP
jgi:hypothetical protein